MAKDTRHGGTYDILSAGASAVGFAACGPTRDLDKDAALVGELYAIYVLPDFWGEGCGHAMCERLEMLTSAKFIQVNLWVLDGNARARQFYEREGFRIGPGASKDAQGGSVKLPEVRYWKSLTR
jgi:GNAT superfamily N-acetyltransferase